MNKPARLDKRNPITITLTPNIIVMGLTLLAVILVLGFGSIENVNYLLLGI